MSYNFRNSFILITLLFFWNNLIYTQDYFQQQVDYTISVSLDTERKTLTGTIKIHYTNHSSDTLSEMFFHLWPNAYSSKTSAFAKQQLAHEENEFYFAPDSVMGYITDLDFNIDGTPTSYKPYNHHVDIAHLKLSKPILPGESSLISTPFTVKLPNVFSRMGYHKGTYHLTQWYPKPAVYDREGWHPMPYLDMGEFYSEFGSFQVEINLPSNYVVAATGVLLSDKELQFRDQLLKHTETADDTPGFQSDVYASDRKTIQFRAANVHDFAWFTNPEFLIKHKDIILPSGKKIDAFCFYPPEDHKEWNSSLNYMEDAIQYFSKEVGDYPYPQVSAVSSSVFAGGGMEYPMITVIDEVIDQQYLDRLLAHEIGHNWFYSALGTNERKHPWMDEGITTFYELKYGLQKYKSEDPYEAFLPPLVFPGDLEMMSPHYFYLFQARRKYEQESGLPADSYSPLNYGLAVYLKPALALFHLESYLGEEKFKELMRKYFKEWNGKHPSPRDFQNVMSSGIEEDLGWFFEDLLYSKKVLDYRLTSASIGNDKLEVTIQNKGEIEAPFELAIFEEDDRVYSKWIEGFSGDITLEFEPFNATQIIIDPDYKTLDINRKNNAIKLSGLAPRARRMEVELFSTTENSRNFSLNFLPVLGGNAYDKFMIGAWIFDPIFPESNFHASLVPLYAFGTKDLVGLAHLQYSFYPSSNLFRRIKVSTSMRSFHKDRNKSLAIEQRYTRISPSLQMDFASRANSGINHHLIYSAHWVNEDFVNFFSQDSFELINEASLIHQLKYHFIKKGILNPWSLKLQLEQQSYTSLDGSDQNYLKFTGEYKTKIHYRANKKIDLRLFGSFFPVNTQRQSANYNKRIVRGSIAMFHQGFNDYNYEDYYFGRSEQSGLWSKQIDTHKGGGFKNALSSRYSLGQTNDFAVAINLKSDLPFRVPILSMFKPYLDMAYYNFKGTSSEAFRGKFLYSAGLMIDLPEEIMSIHFPLFYSSDIKSIYNDLGGFGSRISFHFNLNKFNPYRILEDIH